MFLIYIASRQMIKRCQICRYKTRSIQLVQDVTGSGEKYENVYLYCTLLKKRIRKKDCKYCTLKETLDDKTIINTKGINH
jgi:hypothetical protein